MSIEVQQVSKNYGAQKALDGVSFKIKSGEIVGFLGPNGAGKSTLMKIITTYISQSDGNVTVNGHNVSTEPMRVKESVGYLPEHNPLYLDMYVKEYIQFNASIHKVSKERVAKVIEQIGLIPEAHKKIRQLSKGYRHRVGLAAALLHDPEVLILDEPTTGMDDTSAQLLVALVNKIANETNISIIFSIY